MTRIDKSGAAASPYGELDALAEFEVPEELRARLYAGGYRSVAELCTDLSRVEAGTEDRGKLVTVPMSAEEFQLLRIGLAGWLVGGTLDDILYEPGAAARLQRRP